MGATSNHSFILKNDDTLWSCGYNSSGQLGLGYITNRNTFTKVDVTNVKQVSCGYEYSFILKNDGTLWSCGNNYYGQLWSVLNHKYEIFCIRKNKSIRDCTHKELKPR